MTSDYHAPTQPDILEVIADLSNDEVRTPPSVANAVLDLLPAEVWTDSTLRWLDPGVKTGVFLREITKRLLIGLATKIPDEEKRLEHILKNQVFGIAITELTALMGRRTLYCSKDASSDKSIVKMDTPSGNLWFERTRHLFAKGRCTVCGASEEKFDAETKENYAYAFIHEHGRLRYQEDHEMKFDIIVGNPPYQMDADSVGQNVVPVYTKFVLQAIELEPRYLSFVIPARWMGGGKGLESVRDKMLHDSKVSDLVDIPNALDVFPNVSIEGGVCYFLWDANHQGECRTKIIEAGTSSATVVRDLGEFDVHVRDHRAIPILRKVLSQNAVVGFNSIVSTRDPFGPSLGTNLKDFRLTSKRKSSDIACHLNTSGKREIVWIDPALVTKSRELIPSWKIFVPKAHGGGKSPDSVIGKTTLGEPHQVCTATYLVVGPFQDESQAISANSYMQTRFFRFFVSLRKASQDITSSKYSWVPILTWDREWTDEELYKKYGITKDEQAYIESMIKEMPS